MPITTFDAIDALAGVAPETPLAALRERRADVARFAQGSFSTLFAPEDSSHLSQAERELVALRVAQLTNSPALADLHRQRLTELGADNAEVLAAAQPGWPAATPRLSAILRHTDLLTNNPAAASPADIAALTAAGLTPQAVVTLAQLIAFLSFQVRVAAGLRALQEQ